MARANVALAPSTKGGTNAPATTIGADGVAIPNDGRVRFLVENPTGGSISVVFQTPVEPDGLPLTDRTVSMAAAAIKTFGPYEPAIYNQTSGAIWVDGNGLKITPIS